MISRTCPKAVLTILLPRRRQHKLFETRGDFEARRLSLRS
jgi:hypothetical protein